MLGLLEKFGANTLYVVAFGGIVMAVTVFLMFDIQSTRTVHYMLISAPVWLPVITFYLFFEYWMLMVRKKYVLNQGRVTLEIKLPQDIFKSPEAMELVLIQLHQTAAPDNHVQTYWDGKHPPVYGLEIVSRGGDIKFYMSVPRKKFKNLAESQLYAQYPGVEITALDVDYAAEIPWDESKYYYFSLHMGLKKADAYPIKTYIEYGLDRLPKEEEKVDPITSMLETLGSIGPGEFIWHQILIDANRKITFKEGALSTIPDWKDAAKEEIANIIKEANKRVGIDPDKKVGEGERKPVLTMMNVSDGEKETIKAIERSIGKNAFNVTIRSMYIAEKQVAQPGERIGAVITCWRSYDDINRNAIGVKWRTDFDWNWWQDPHGHHASAYKQAELDEYKRRDYTMRSHDHDKVTHKLGDASKVMTTEELATIFHLPGKVATTPSLARIPSKRAEAPSNLPIGTL
jgi:hypothetical protein